MSKIQQHFENDKYRFEITLESRSIVTHSMMEDLPMDIKADIRQLLYQTIQTVVYVIETAPRR